MGACGEESAIAVRGLSATATVDSSGHNHEEALGVTVVVPAAGRAGSLLEMTGPFPGRGGVADQD
jgi:hypothetical protein